MTFTTVTDARDYISRTWGDWLSNSNLSCAQVEYLCEFLGKRLWRDQLPLDAEGEIEESFMESEIQRVLGSDFYAAVRDDQIVAWTTAADDGEAQLWHRGYPGTDLVVLDLAADETPAVGACVDVDYDGVAVLDDA